MNLREYAAQQKGQQSPTEGKQPAPPLSYKAIYRAVFDFHGRYSTPPQTLEEWQSFARDIGETSSSLNNDPFAMDLLAAVYNELERQDKARSAAPAEPPADPEHGF